MPLDFQPDTAVAEQPEASTDTSQFDFQPEGQTNKQFDFQVEAPAPSDSPTPQTDSALAQLNKLAQTPSPPFLHGVEEAVKGLIPKSIGAAGKMIGESITPVTGAVEDVIQAGKNVAQVAQGAPIEQTFQEKSFDQYTTEDWGKFVGQMGIQAAMAIPAFKGLRPEVRARITAEPVAREPVSETLQPETARIGGETYATQEGQIRQGGEPEYIGVSPRENVPEDIGQAREIGSEPPSDSGGVGAAQAEPVEAPELTSTKNEIVGQEREARGLEPAVEAARRDFGTVWDQAAAESARDPSIGERLVTELSSNPRALSDTENAHLLRRQIEVQNEHDAAIQDVNAHPEDVTAQARLERARDNLQASYNASEVAGRETGRGLNARKMLAANDFSLAKMEAETRAVVNKGKPLSFQQIKEVESLHQRIATAEAKLASYEARDAFNEALKQAKIEARKAGKAGGGLQGFLDQQAVRARERIVARRGRLYADPTGVTQVAHLTDEAIIGASHIARGITKFADWSEAMIKELGEKIKPHLKALYARAKELATKAGKEKLTPEERESRLLAGEKKGIITRTEKLKTKLAAGEFERPVKKPPRMDKEKADLIYEYHKLRDEYHRLLLEAERKQQPLPKKILGGAREGLSFTRALMTSFDLSAVLRQGGFIAMGHPLRAAKIFPDMFRALASEKGRFIVNEQIRNRPNAKSGLYQQAKLYLADERLGGSLSKMEEVYASRWAQKVPGIAASERAYTTFLNRLRADSFDALAASLSKGGKPTLPEARAIGNFVNVATGRGDMGKFATAANALSQGFFAPRYVLSRFQTILGQPLYKGTFRTRAMIAGEYAKMLTGLGTIYALGMALKPDSVETDPRSTDFGKLKFGNTRVDPLFGLQQTTVLLARELTGKSKTYRGMIEPIRGRVPYGKPTGFDVATRFLRSKLAPVPGGVANLLTGKDYAGQPVTAASTALNLLTPIGGNDIYKAMIDQGVPKGTAMALLSILGMNIQTYDPKKNRVQARVSP